MKYREFQINSLLVLILIMLYIPVTAQHQGTAVKGRITDAVTHQPLPFVAIVFANTSTGTVSDTSGYYFLSSKNALNKVEFSFLGYEDVEVSIRPNQSQTLNISMVPKVNILSEVEVKPAKRRYKNKDNPAVTLIGKVIKNKSQNRQESFDFYQYEKYEKTQFALSHVSDKLKDNKALKKFSFVFANTDTTKIEGSKILPLYLKETLSDYYYRKSPKATKEIVKADKLVSFDEYIDDKGVAEYMKYLYQDINIYNNSVTFVSNLFLSPIATTAPAFYRYYIQDTVMVSGKQCVELFFSPRNKTDMLFQGIMYITLDSSYAVKRLEMSVNQNINLNWVKTVNIVQDFEQVQNQGWLLTSDEISIDFGVTKNSMGIFGQRIVSYKNYLVNKPIEESIFKGLEQQQPLAMGAQGDAYMEDHRHQQLTESESGTYMVADSIKKMPAFKRTMDFMMLMLSGYKDLGYFEVGPINTFYSYNPIEGVRMRVGGRTTPKFSKKINFDSYLAYGFTDNEYKYYLGATYSLTDNTIYKFPVKSLKVSYQDETMIPGQELRFVQEDNILLSIKRGVNDKLFYNKTFKIEHLNEFANHFSYSMGYSFTKQTPAGTLYFSPNMSLPDVNDSRSINISEANLYFRYAPHEQFYEGKVYRTPISNQYPVFQLQLRVGSKLLNNDYEYQKLQTTINSRFYMSVLGYTDVVFEAGKTWGKVPYPLLTIHRANQTYSYQMVCYNLMNFLEFVSDQYISVNVDHCFNGFFLNKIPLLNKLNLREDVTCKVLYGSLSDRNNPALHDDLFRFPTDSQGIPLTYTLESKPYIEVSAGISNIFNFLRVDVVKRFSYLDHPNVTDIGIRARFKFDF